MVDKKAISQQVELEIVKWKYGKANLKNIFVSPYPTPYYRYGLVRRKLLFLTSQIGYPLNSIVHSKTCLKRPLNKRQKIVCFIKTDYRIMQVKSIAECSQEAFCNTFELHLALICLNDLRWVYLSEAVLGRFYCIVLLWAIKLNIQTICFR